MVDAEAASIVRRQNQALFLRMLGHLGRKEFDAFEACLTADFVQEWPYKPLPSLPDRLSGAKAVRTLIEQGMSDFAPYEYHVETLHALEDAYGLIAEYTSHSHFIPRDVVYSNRYIGVLRFREDRVCYWREYVNPLIIKETLLTDFDKSIQERIGAGAQQDPVA